MCFLKSPYFWIAFGTVSFIFESLLIGFDRITIEVYLYLTVISVLCFIYGMIKA